MSHGHIRLGSFQRLAFHDDQESIARLIDYCLRQLLNVEPGASPALTLLETVVSRTADLAASYMVAGFVHGVLNSDNIAITAESFDYGPWRFTPLWSPGFTAAYFDQNGLYCFARQAEAIHWDVAQLAHALQSQTDIDSLVDILRRYPAIYEERLIARFLWRAGYQAGGIASARAFVEAAVIALRESDILIDRFFFDVRRGALPEGDYAGPLWDKVRHGLDSLEPKPGHLDHAYWRQDAPCSMHIDEVEAIWAAIAERDDWGPLHEKVAAIRIMGEPLGGPKTVPS